MMVYPTLTIYPPFAGIVTKLQSHQLPQDGTIALGIQSAVQLYEPLTWRLVSSSAVLSVGLLKAFRIPAFTLWNKTKTKYEM